MKATDTVQTGELKGVITTAVQLPNVPCNLAKLKALSTNAGGVYIGGQGVKQPTANDSTVTGYELQPGEETGWMPISNLNRLWRICDTVNDELVYIALL